MKTKVTVNIDTVDFSVNGERNSFNIPDAKIANVISPEGELLDSYQNRTSMSGQFGAHSMNVRTLHMGHQLRIEGSPYGSTYGQNVFTSSDMKKAVLPVLKQACKMFSIKPSKEQKQRWTEGDIDLHRVDLVVNFRLDSETEVLTTLKQIRRQLGEQSGSMKTSGTSVYWAPKDGKEYSIGFYAKGPQMRRQKRFNDLPGKDRLLDECASILRIEVRLRAHALREIGLDKVGTWNEDSAQLAFSKYMRRLRLLTVTAGVVTAKELDALPNRLRPVLALHKSGCKLEQIYPTRTLQRHRSDFRKRGVDLRCPNQQAETVIPLTKVLSPKKAIKGAPVWMQEAGLVPPMVVRDKPQQAVHDILSVGVGVNKYDNSTSMARG